MEASFGSRQRYVGKGSVDISHGGVGKRRLPHDKIHHFKVDVTHHYDKTFLKDAGNGASPRTPGAGGKNREYNFLYCPTPVKYHEAPDHLQDNEYIVGGYRTNYTFWDCTKSLFFLHNETMNIWTVRK